MQQASKGEKHLPYLHIGTLSVHNSVSENYKDSKLPRQGCQSNTSTRTLSWITELVSYAHVLGPVERS